MSENNCIVESLNETVIINQSVECQRYYLYCSHGNGIETRYKIRISFQI